MYSPSKEAFLEKAKQGNLIPVYREIVADQETPVLVYERLRSAMREAGEKLPSFLLESVDGGEHIARYSFIGCGPREVITAVGRKVEIASSGGDREQLDDVDPLDVLKQRMEHFRPVTDPELPRFFGGAVGYFGYDMVTQFEKVPLASEPGLAWPDMIMMITDTIIIFDRVKHTVKVVVNASVDGDPSAAYEAAARRVDEMCAALSSEVSRDLIDAAGDVPELQSRSNVAKKDFEAAVERAKEYIRAGDIIQTVLSQRFEVDYTADPLDAYRALRSVNPSPYMFCLEFGELAMVGSSPEIHVRCDDGHVEVRPIAGTRPRSGNEERDAELAEELLADPKERAEHIMLVDLGRNDVGRVCEYGSIDVPELMVIEKYSHVMHIVSDVIGKLRDDQDIYDVLRATFPAGTVSGAPKIRAMEIIAELEAERRGPYAGAVGYFSFTGNLDSCITIRTILMDGERACVQAGAGIVADSDPTKEFEETQNKARGMLRALALSQRYSAARGNRTANFKT